MALKSYSNFQYNITVNATNQNVPFQAANSGPALNGAIPYGTYSLAQLALQIANAMNTVDTANTYTCTINRSYSSMTGLQITMTISTSGTYLSLLFSSGAQALNSIRSLCNFGTSDLTGQTSYTNFGPIGTSLVTSWYGFNYSPPWANVRNYGSVNVATDGTKEGITWAVQQFIEVEFKYEAQANVMTNWNPLFTWMMEQNPFEFTPEITNPTTYYPVTLEKSAADGKGLAFIMREMLPDFPFMFQTGLMTMRVITNLGAIG